MSFIANRGRRWDEVVVNLRHVDDGNIKRRRRTSAVSANADSAWLLVVGLVRRFVILGNEPKVSVVVVVDFDVLATV